MVNCAIFNAFDAVKATNEEIRRLIDIVPDAFADSQIHAEFDEEDGSQGDGRMGFHFKVKLPQKRQRSDKQFLLFFDMWRPQMSTTWSNARDSLLTFAYSSNYQTGWVGDYVSFNMSGKLDKGEARANTKIHPSGKLIEWNSTAVQWYQKEWLFSVPLIKISDREAFYREVVTPVASLLLQDQSPEAVFRETSAIQFPNEEAII